MITQKDIELIDRYLSGNLSPDDLKLFENRKKTDKEFAAQILFMQDLKIGIRQAERKDLKKKLQKIASDYENTSHEGWSLKSYFALAASIALLIAFVGIFYLLQTKKGDSGFADTNEKTDSAKVDSLKNRNSFDIEKYIAENTIKPEAKTFVLNNIGDESFGFAGSDTVKIEAIVIKDNKYSMHYLLKEKLYLFGDFAVGEIKIFNLKSSTRNAIILKDKSFFYEISMANVGNLLPLIQLEDSTLIKRLEQ